MQVTAGKLQVLTVAAMLVLVSGGVAAYALNQPTPRIDGSTGSPLPMANATNSTSTTNTTVTTTSSTTTTPQTLCQGPTPTVSRLVLPITAVSAAASGSISFTNDRGCVATISTVGGIFSVSISLQLAKPVTEYNAVLVANGTSYSLGNMVTDQRGSGGMQNQVLLTTGTYVVSIKIYDTSTTPGTNTLVLQTGQGTIVSQPFPAATSGQWQNQTQGQDDHDDDR